MVYMCMVMLMLYVTVRRLNDRKTDGRTRAETEGKEGQVKSIPAGSVKKEWPNCRGHKRGVAAAWHSPLPCSAGAAFGLMAWA